jgi:hypothetical protein
VVSQGCDIELGAFLVVLVGKIFDLNGLYRGVVNCASKVVCPVDIFDGERFDKGA